MDGPDTGGPLGRQLSEAARFAYAGLCGVSLAHLFPEKEQRSFCTDFLEDLVTWLDLSDSVLPAMEAFARGMGGEGTETFTMLLLEEPAMKVNPDLITQDLVTFSLRDGYYDSRSRVLVSHITRLLGIPEDAMEVFEESLTESLKENKEKPSEMAEASRKKREKKKKIKRYLLIGLATIGGGTVIGLMGGLAAPFVAAGAATVIGTAGAAALGSTAGIAIMASLFGAAGAGLTGYKMKKRVGAIEEFEFLPLTGGRHLHITIAITGWLCTGKYGSFVAPWQSLLDSTEQYCLAWESKYLMELGNTLDALLNGLVNMMAQEALKYTVLSGIVTALTWPASLLAVASVIDNPWGVCLSRSAEVGKHLAHILLSRQQGKRPVTLVGFSLGARVIYFCLKEMAREKDCEGIIQDVVLLGAPVEGDAKCWKPLTKVVAGRIINGYCRGDWLLSFVYRSSSAKLNVAGLQPVRLEDRRMVNVDLSSVVNGHLDYMKQMEILLKAVGIKTRECFVGELKGAPFQAEVTTAKEGAACDIRAEEDSSFGSEEQNRSSILPTDGAGEEEQSNAAMRPAGGSTCIDSAHDTGEGEQCNTAVGPAGGSTCIDSAHDTGEGEQCNTPVGPAGGSTCIDNAHDTGEGEQCNTAVGLAGGSTCIDSAHDTGEGEQCNTPVGPAGGSTCIDNAHDTGEGEQCNTAVGPAGGSTGIDSAHDTGEEEQCNTPMGPAGGSTCIDSAHDTGEEEQCNTPMGPAGASTGIDSAHGAGKGEQCNAAMEPEEGPSCLNGAHGSGDRKQCSAPFLPAEGIADREMSSAPANPAEGICGRGQSSSPLSPAESTCDQEQCHSFLQPAEVSGEREESSAHHQPAERDLHTEDTINSGDSEWTEGHHSPVDLHEDQEDTGWTWDPVSVSEAAMHHPDSPTSHSQAPQPKCIPAECVAAQ